MQITGQNIYYIYIANESVFAWSVRLKFGAGVDETKSTVAW